MPEPVTPSWLTWSATLPSYARRLAVIPTVEETTP